MCGAVPVADSCTGEMVGKDLEHGPQDLRSYLLSWVECTAVLVLGRRLMPTSADARRTTTMPRGKSVLELHGLGRGAANGATCVTVGPQHVAPKQEPCT